MRPNVAMEVTANQYIGKNNFIIFHRVLSMTSYHAISPPDQKKDSPPIIQSKGTIPSQYDMSFLTSEVILYNNQSTLESLDIDKYHSVIQNQWQIGLETVKRLTPMMNTERVTKVSTTSFASHLKDLRHKFVMFTPEHC